MIFYYVHFNVVGLSGSVVAEITCERLFASVREHVPLKEVRTLERPVTNNAMSVTLPALSGRCYMNNLQPTLGKPLLQCRMLPGHVSV